MSTVNPSRPRSNGASSRPSSRVNKPTPVPSRPASRTVAAAPAGAGTGSSASSAAAANDNAKRQIVGQYMLGKTIGEGTFGKVKLAVHMPTGEKVAVKILEKSRIKDSADVRRVNREIKILKKARHDNIIQLYEVLDTQHAIYLIMECAEGGEMFDFIVACKHVPEVQACKFFHQVVDGVDALHKNDITHRDLKPENLLLKASPDGWLVKVVDFGLSNTHEGNRMLSTACGSPCYAAPEMIAGKKYQGPLADIWSMGVILFALVCGFLPFEDANTSVLYKKILSGEYKTPKWISPEVKDLIRRILETDPRRRYTMADIRKHPWYNLVAEKDIPREIVNVYEDEQSRTETINQLTTAGVDTQALLDGLASHACNSLTALYYLSEQKFRARKATQVKQAGEEVIPQTRSDLTNKSSPETQDVPTTQPPQQQQQLPLAAIAVKPSPLFGATPAVNVHPQQGIAAPHVQPIAALKTIQQPVKHHQAPPTNAMPSLDYYMRTGLSIPIGNSNENTSTAVNSNPDSGKAKPILPVGRVGGGEIPKLNLNKPKPTIPPLQKPPPVISAIDPLVSQTARGPVPTVKVTTTSTANPPQSARAVLSGDTGFVQPNVNPMDTGFEADGRPGTRRSRGRSRGAANESGFDGPPQGLFDSATHAQQPQFQPPIRAEQIAMKDTSAHGEPPATTTASEQTATVENATPLPTAEVVVITVTPTAPISSRPSGVPTVVKAPESAPRSGSATQAGRRGKHLVVSANPAPTAQRTGSSSSKNSQSDPRQEANKNRIAAQGTFNISVR